MILYSEILEVVFPYYKYKFKCISMPFIPKVNFMIWGESAWVERKIDSKTVTSGGVSSLCELQKYYPLL